MTRVTPGHVGWAEGLAAAGQRPGDEVAAGPLSRRARVAGDGVERAGVPDDGADASAAASGRGPSTVRARALARALSEARDEVPRFRGDFGEFTAALADASSACHGELREVLDEALALRAEVAAGMGSISSG